MPSLECGICGGPAIESEDNLFYEDEGEECITCGFPGKVMITDNLLAETEEDDMFEAYWNPDESDESYEKWIAADPGRAERLGYLLQ